MRTCHTVVLLAVPPVSWPVRAPAFIGEPRRACAGIGGRSSAWRTAGLHEEPPWARRATQTQTVPGGVRPCPHPKTLGRSYEGDVAWTTGTGAGIPLTQKKGFVTTDVCYAHPWQCYAHVCHLTGGFVSPMRTGLETRVVLPHLQTRVLRRDAMPTAAWKAATAMQRWGGARTEGSRRGPGPQA